jgi:hypothetical protein
MTTLKDRLSPALEAEYDCLVKAIQKNREYVCGIGNHPARREDDDRENPFPRRVEDKQGNFVLCCEHCMNDMVAEVLVNNTKGPAF